MGLNAKSFLPLIATIGLATTACGPDDTRPQYKGGTEEQRVAIEKLLSDTEAECFDRGGHLDEAKFFAEKGRILGEKINEVRAKCGMEKWSPREVVFKVQTSEGTRQTQFKGGAGYLPSSPIVEEKNSSN